MASLTRKDFTAAVGVGGTAALLGGCSAPRENAGSGAAPTGAGEGTASTVGIGEGAAAIAQARGLTPDEVNAALRTFVPPGKHDDYVMFASGGHSGQVVVMGVPSMRILKVIPVFTPDSYVGYGYDATPFITGTRIIRRSRRRTATTTASICSSTIRSTLASQSST